MSFPSLSSWRAMEYTDLPHVYKCAERLFPDHHEEYACFVRRWEWGRDFCMVLPSVRPDQIDGYLVAYPWPYGSVPPLNQVLPFCPQSHGWLYLSDLAVEKSAPGGQGKAAVATLVSEARDAGCAGIALVAVNHSESFWRRQGFASQDAGALPAGALMHYGEDAVYMVLDGV